MRHLLSLLLLSSAIALLAGIPAAYVSASAGVAEIRHLIEQLGSNDFKDRSEATTTLDAIGEPALTELRKAEGSDDPEVRQRAKQLVKKIERRLVSERLLAPTKVKLMFKNTPIAEAVAELSKQCARKIELKDENGKLKDRTITLNTGETTFWEAFDRFCTQANLVEEELTGAGQPALVRPGRPGRAAIPSQLGDERITLADGKSITVPTVYAGAVRVRVTPVVTPDQIRLNLAVSFEPKVQCCTNCTVQVNKAVDNNGQSLSYETSLPPAPGLARFRRLPLPVFENVFNQHLQTSLMAEKKASKSLKEVCATLYARVLAEPQTAITVDNVLKSVGTAFKGKEGCEIKILEVSKGDDGRITIRVELEQPDDFVPSGGASLLPWRGRGQARAIAAPMIVAPNGVAVVPRRTSGLSLFDGKGKSIEQVSTGVSARRVGPAGIVSEYSLVFQLRKDQEVAKLVFTGSKMIDIEIPFALKDVDIP